MEYKLQELIESIVFEVVSELNKRGIKIISEEKYFENNCFCKDEKVNPSCCKTSDLKAGYLLRIKIEFNDIMAL